MYGNGMDMVEMLGSLRAGTLVWGFRASSLAEEPARKLPLCHHNTRMKCQTRKPARRLDDGEVK